jgi:preprotein translocase subunit SecE
VALTVGAFLQELFHVGIYKRSQGRITRQVTFAALAVTFALGLFRLHQALFDNWSGSLFGLAYWLPGVLLLVGWWASYRVVNMPSFADFLIAVEAELNKVSWPTRSELFRASMVVLICIIFLAIVLFTFDVAWQWFFRFLKIL